MPARKRKITFVHRLEFAFVIAVVFILRAMPLKTASAMMGRIWRIVAPRTRRQSRAMEQLRTCFPDKSEKELHQITLGMWDNLGRTAAEGLLTDKFLSVAGSMMEQPEGIEDLVAEMHRVGGVIVSLHSGNWELGGVLAVEHGYDACVIIQRLKNPLVHEYMVDRRGSTFKGGIFSKGDRAGERVKAALKGGTVAAIMADLRDGRGVKVPFFGRPAPTNTFPAQIARQKNIPLVAVRILRKDGIRFIIEVKQINVPHSDDADADIYAATAETQAVFESWVRAEPEQWMWAHRRWG